jgi:hypothetical protein
MATDLQNKQVSRLLWDGETDAKNVSVDGPLEYKSSFFLQNVAEQGTDS